jgi:1-acyl-sn-glycerol-3-phosphate acyltransferase
MRRRIILGIIRLILKLFCRVQVIGLGNVPRQGAVILAINHMSLADPPLAAVVINRPDMTALVGDTHQKNPALRLLVNGMGGIWINRQAADLHALRQGLDFLAKGGLLGIAPEGTRSRVASMISAKIGVAYLADKAKAPIIPTAISGTEVVFHDMLLLRRPKISIQFGQPFCLPPLDRKDREAGLVRNTDEIMCRIAAMLPAKYWGVYRDHPRLAELIEQQQV